MNLKIEKLVFEGYGFGRDENDRPVFVYKSVPGDEIEIEKIDSKSSFSKAKIKSVVKDSPDRIEPTCPYFEQCGGCEHQNISYQNQLKYKEQIFEEVLKRAGINTEIKKIIPGSKEEFYYRNVIRYSMQTDEKNEINFFMHNFDYKRGLIQIDQCLLQSKTSNLILSSLKQYINHNIEDKDSFQQLRIREGKFTDEFMIEIITKNNNLPHKKEIVSVLSQIKGIKSIYHTISHLDSLQDAKRQLLFGSPIIYEKIEKYKFQISPESFFQTNSIGVSTLYDTIKKMANIKMGNRVLDLYCGTGTISIYLSTLAKKITGVEIVPEAIRDAKDNAKINHIANVDFIVSDSTKWIKNTKEKFNNIIVDPPRSGLSKELIFDLSKIDLETFTYVSCNPATFARDTKEIEKQNLKLISVQPIDMFPQTHHIECVGLFVRQMKRPLT